MSYKFSSTGPGSAVGSDLDSRPSPRAAPPPAAADLRDLMHVRTGTTRPTPPGSAAGSSMAGSSTVGSELDPMPMPASILKPSREPRPPRKTPGGMDMFAIKPVPKRDSIFRSEMPDEGVGGDFSIDE